MSLKQTISLPCGPVLAHSNGGVIHARGIPYAQATRFQEAYDLPTRDSDSILDCTKPATICPQDPSRLEKVMGPAAEGREQSEDCLHLSITAPAQASDAPVMVFFHGGAYVSGGGDLDVYSGHELTKFGVVVVSVTYRLSVFGYLRIPGYAPANLGLLDQIAALRWVKGNITGFGGNAGNVTIFGQSAGGDSVFCLLLAESATAGLFQRAIIQSAPFDWYADDKKTTVINDLGQHARKYLDEHTEPSASDLLNLKRELQSLGKELDPTGILTFGTELGQSPLPSAGEVDDTLRRLTKRVPIVIGWNQDEGTAFATQGPEFATQAEVITRKGFSSGAQYYQNLVGDNEQGWSSYEFNWSPPDSIYGATHCIELPFLLGDWDTWKAAPMLNGKDSEETVQQLGTSVKKVWVTFAQGEALSQRHLVISQNLSL